MKKFFGFKWVLIAACYLLIINCFFSCNGKINIVENTDGTKNISGTIGFSKTAEAELQKLLGAMGGTSDEPIISSRNISDFLAFGGGTNINVSSKTKNNFIFSATMPKGFEISSKKCAEIYHYLDEESMMYVDLLMAPIFTGEEMSVAEYEMLLASVYGEAFAKEFVSGKIEITSGSTKKVFTAGQFFCGVAN